MRKIVAILGSLVGALTLLTGCMSFGASQQANTNFEPGTLVFDYYYGDAGLPVEPGYREITLTTTDDADNVRMDIYQRSSGPDEEARHWAYLVPSQALDDVMAVVREYRMTDWNKHDYPGMTGGVYSCKFWHGDEFVSASSGCMPEEGTMAFSSVEAVLNGYVGAEGTVELDVTADASTDASSDATTDDANRE